MHFCIQRCSGQRWRSKFELLQHTADRRFRTFGVRGVLKRFHTKSFERSSASSRERSTGTRTLMLKTVLGKFEWSSWLVRNDSLKFRRTWGIPNTHYVPISLSQLRRAHLLELLKSLRSQMVHLPCSILTVAILHHRSFRMWISIFWIDRRSPCNDEKFSSKTLQPKMQFSP